jgi:hypothetical protein
MQEDDLYALIYVSHGTRHIKDDAANRMIEDILTTSRARNAKLDVTGALLFTESCFTQILEGPKEAVALIFDAIECDARHRDVTLISFKPAPQRYFPEWSMAYAGVSSGPGWASQIEGLLAEPSVIDGDRAGLLLIELMTGLIREQEVQRPLLRRR